MIKSLVSTVPQAFEEFYQNINLDSDDRELVQEHKELREKLRQLFSLNGSPSDFLSGSYARNTIIRPPHDVDFLICFDPSKEPNDKYNVGEAKEFHEFVIQSIRDHRDIFGEYDWRIKSQRSSINIRRKESSFGFDIVPSFPEEDNFRIADKDNNEWKTTNPRTFDDLLRDKNNDLGKMPKRLIKMVKRWNYRKDKPLKSFFIEVYVFNIINRKPQSTQLGIVDIFKRIRDSIYAPLYDPALPGSQINYYTTHEEKDNAHNLLDDALSFAEQAVEQERKGNIEEALKNWRRIFGSDFPIIENEKKESHGKPESKGKHFSNKSRDIKFG